ncbi:hypothetical protein SESBI_17907 [Sesbania bispinosa]|nr:hypothetical protein SESBI_17907 [Sesbania bispinosa]
MSKFGYALIQIFGGFCLRLCIKSVKSEVYSTNGAQPFPYHVKALEFIWNHLGYKHVWPELEFGWEIIVGTLIGIFGAAFGSVGGVGGGGIFVPMLILVIGFDPKSATAISKWTSIKAYFKGVETWKKETIVKEESIRLLESTVGKRKLSRWWWASMETRRHEGSILGNIYWKQFGLISLSGLHSFSCRLPRLYNFLFNDILDNFFTTGTGFVMGPLFLELGIVPQVASATSLLE